ncbi:MAG: hypothetical protein AABY22_18590 [Nanoarchaeota archaeon]
MNKLIKIWEQTPDQRFGQFLINQGIVEDNLKFWQLEDDAFEMYIDSYIEEKRIK